jgi:NitT/TauT family transport system substrate-binding protein
MQTRRQAMAALAGTALAVTAPAFVRRAAAQSAKVNIGLGGYTFAFLPVLAADATGLFAKQKLNVALTTTGGGANTMAAMIGGSVDVAGLVMSDIILAASKRQRVVAFVPLMTQYASDAVISKAAAEKAGITADMPTREKLRRLKGMTLAISSRGSGIDKLWRYLLEHAGLDPDKDVTLTVIKLDQMYPALRAGQIDGFNISAPVNNRVVAEGLGLWVARPSQGDVPGLENFLYTVLAAKPDYVAANKETLVKLSRALNEANALIRTEPDQVARALKETYLKQSDLELLRLAVADQKSAYPEKMTLTRPMFDQNVAFMTRYGDDVKAVQFAEVVEPAIVAGVN